MRQLVTTGIVLGRTDYGEADRILTLLTPDHGKLRLMAKGVRRIKSKLAGGIELFSVSDVTFIKGKSDMGTLASSRLIKHYGTIVQDINRTMVGYDLIKTLNKATEDNPEAEYFHLLEQAFEALDDAAVDLQLVQLWFAIQLLRFAGHSPNLKTDTAGNKLDIRGSYDFSFDDMAFTARPDGHFTANHIKFLRLIFSGNQPKVLQKLVGSEQLSLDCKALVQGLTQSVRI
jgi:DNA repair protein RecO (recombination protein O)